MTPVRLSISAVRVRDNSPAHHAPPGRARAPHRAPEAHQTSEIARKYEDSAHQSAHHLSHRPQKRRTKPRTKPVNYASLGSPKRSESADQNGERTGVGYPRLPSLSPPVLEPSWRPEGSS